MPSLRSPRRSATCVRTAGERCASARSTRARRRRSANYLSDPRDLKVAADAIRLTRRIAAAPALAAFRPQEYKPGPEYRSEEDLQRAAAEIGTTIFHPAGTCRMGQGRKRWWMRN